MTPEGFQKAVYDLGWIALAQHALNLRAADAHALRCLVRRAGRPVTHEDLAADYAARDNCTGTSNGVRLRLQRARAALADVGCSGVIQTIAGEKAYRIEVRDVCRIEAALLTACGVQLEPEER